MTPTLSIQNVTKRFAGKVAVDDVSFDIMPGEIVGFLGPNGAGKTTSLRMALGLINPDEGQVKLFGDTPGAGAFGRVGFLPEERGLYKKQTAFETIVHMARLNGIKKGEAKKLADRLLSQYGLGEAKKKKNKDMSKGMAQKVQLLAAIAHDPEFYILDEPFSGLDPVNQQVLENMVREIADRGHTIMFSTHVMEHAERLCDRIILMSGGRKVFDGSTEAALDEAPRRLVIGSEDARLKAYLEPHAQDLKTLEGGEFEIDLKPGHEAQTILEACVNNQIKLTGYEPMRPTLHEAFVALVGADEMAKMDMETVGQGGDNA